MYTCSTAHTPSTYSQEHTDGTRICPAQAESCSLPMNAPGTQHPGTAIPSTYITCILSGLQGCWRLQTQHPAARGAGHASTRSQLDRRQISVHPAPTPCPSKGYRVTGGAPRARNVAAHERRRAASASMRSAPAPCQGQSQGCRVTGGAPRARPRHGAQTAARWCARPG